MTYKREAFDMFDQLVAALRREVSASVMHATIRVDQPGAPTPARRARGVAPPTSGAPVRVSNVRESGGGADSSSGGVAVASRPTTPSGQKVGRNAPCPCGSGKKYKRCCGKAA